MDGGLLKTVIGSITRQQLVALLRAGEPIVLVEALGPAFFADAHLPGAINLPPAAVGESVDESLPDRDARIVVYCSRSCEMSLDTAHRLIAIGYTRVEHYAGGKEDWVEAGLPVEREPQARPDDRTSPRDGRSPHDPRTSSQSSCQ